MERISTEYERVMRQGLRPATGGAVKGHGIKTRESASVALDPAVAAAAPGGRGRYYGSGWEMLMKRGRIVSERPLLIIISGGRE